MKIWKILIFTFLIYSCRSESNCLNADIVTKPSDNSITIKLNYNQNQEKLISELEKLFDGNICQEEKLVGLELEKESIQTIFFKTCPEQGTGHRPFSEVEILMNKKGEIMLNSQIMKIDSIDNWIGENFPNELGSEKEEVFFLWDKESPKMKIEGIFGQIRKGYLKSYDRLSKVKFGREFCQLNKNELEIINESLEFRIKLGFGRINIPPPIPSMKLIK